MFIVGNKIYEKCEKCGKLVCINKILFGSLHVCVSSESILDNTGQNVVRTRLRKALRMLGLPSGEDDDESMCDEECGIRLGLWCLCYCELGVGRPNGVCLIHDDEGEHELCEGLLSASKIAGRLRKILDKYDLWKELKC